MSKKRKFVKAEKRGSASGEKNEKREKFMKKDGLPPEYVPDRIRMILSPITLPSMWDVWCPPLMQPFGVEFMIQHGVQPLEDQEKKEEFRALHVAADHAGCGWWRFHEIEDMVNYSKRGHVINTELRFPKQFFLSVNFDAIRLQRQIGPGRAEYWKTVKDMFRETGKKTRLLFEIDDVVCRGKLPNYNEAKDTFENDDVQKSLHDILDVVDEMFVCSPYMRKVYRQYHQSVDISVLPNYASKAWFDGFYDLERRMREFDKHKHRPRVLLMGGATHVDPGQRLLYAENDYTKCVDAIISARRDFEFVIMGVRPNVFRSFIESGEMTYIPWTPQYLYPNKLNELGVQCVIAPLADNDFNRSKSSIKWQESCYMGFGFCGQDLEPYAAARNRFTVGSEMMDLVKKITKDEQSYQEEIEYNRKQAENYWLDDKIDDIITLYKTPYGDEKRKEIKWFVDLNPAQFHIQK